MAVGELHLLLEQPGTGVREYARILVSLVARPRTGSTGWNGTA
jgi:hypothetical protein